MKRIVCLMMTLMLIISTASAQSLLKKLKKAVDTANEVVGAASDVSTGKATTFDMSAPGRVVYVDENFTQRARITFVSAVGDAETGLVTMKLKMTLVSWPQYQEIRLSKMYDVEGNEIDKGEVWNDACWEVDKYSGVMTYKNIFLPTTVTQLGAIDTKMCYGGVDAFRISNINIEWK